MRSDFDFCDTDDGVLGIFAGIANQASNPYFNIAAIARNMTSEEWLASYFASAPADKLGHTRTASKADEDGVRVGGGQHGASEQSAFKLDDDGAARRDDAGIASWRPGTV